MAASFSKYTWDLYLKSDDGKAALRKDVRAWVAQYFGEERSKLVGALASQDTASIDVSNTLWAEDWQIDSFLEEVLDLSKISSQEQAEDLYMFLVEEGIEVRSADGGTLALLAEKHGKKFLPWFYKDIDQFSAALALILPEYFTPFLFMRKFDLFRKICRRFGILLPAIPTKLDKKGRATYYIEVNAALQDFRRGCELSPAEFNAFLYDFAIKEIGGPDPPEDLPDPSRVWFVIGGTGGPMDRDAVDRATDKTVTDWQGNVNARVGDIVVVYLASPDSCIHSIWRVVVPGFVDPFFYFYSAMRIGKPIALPEIPFKELAENLVMKTSPSVRARFQGRSGKEYPIEHYQELLRILEAKGFDTECLPHPPKSMGIPAQEVSNERDLEIKYVEPLLAKLGYSVDDWQRQVQVKIGTRERAIPDYVLLRSSSSGNAACILEAKYDFPLNSKEHKQHFKQARSYGKLLSAKMVVLASRQGLWVHPVSKGDYSFDLFEMFAWGELDNSDRFAELLDAIGKDTFLK